MCCGKAVSNEIMVLWSEVCMPGGDGARDVRVVGTSWTGDRAHQRKASGLERPVRFGGKTPAQVVRDEHA